MIQCIAPEQIAGRWAEFEKVGVEVARSVEGQIQALASAGVKHILWGNLFDVARTPSMTARIKLLAGEQAPTITAALGKAALAHNTEMDAAIDRLKKAHPALHIIKLDLDTRLTEVAANPEKYGFSDFAKGANASRHLFSADGLHLTTQGHRMLAQYAFEVLTTATD
jgi:phospholipase/lecithinase/hemolysin